MRIVFIKQVVGLWLMPRLHRHHFNIQSIKASSKIIMDTSLVLIINTIGADIVIHSVTKYLGGHSDLLGGVLITKDKKVADQVCLNYRCI
jgi:protein involved in ribonucleotide reduction